MTVTNSKRYVRKVKHCREIHFFHICLVQYAFVGKTVFKKNVLELLLLNVYMFKIVELNAHNWLG